MRSVGAGIEPYMLRSVTALRWPGTSGSGSVVVRYDSTSVTSSTPLTDWMFSGSTNVSVGRFDAAVAAAAARGQHRRHDDAGGDRDAELQEVAAVDFFVQGLRHRGVAPVG